MSENDVSDGAGDRAAEVQSPPDLPPPIGCRTLDLHNSTSCLDRGREAVNEERHAQRQLSWKLPPASSR
jgi:hypothetical protein